MVGWTQKSSLGVSNRSDNQQLLPSTIHSSVEWNISEPVLVYHQSQYPPVPQPIPQYPPLPPPVPPDARPAY